MLGIAGVACISGKTMPPFTLRYGYVLHRDSVANDAPESKAHLINLHPSVPLFPFGPFITGSTRQSLLGAWKCAELGPVTGHLLGRFSGDLFSKSHIWGCDNIWDNTRRKCRGDALLVRIKWHGWWHGKPPRRWANGTEGDGIWLFLSHTVSA